MPYCPNCGQQYYENARFCQNCGGRLGTIDTPTMPPPTPTVTRTFVVESKSTGVAALLAGLIGLVGLWGIGHIYVGRVARGAVLLIVGITLYIGMIFAMVFGAITAIFTFGLGLGIPFIYILFIFALWAWQTYDAYSLAKRFNEYMLQYGRAPW